MVEKVEMGTDTPRISDAEWDVMDVVWRLGTVTPAEVIDRVAETRGWNHRTVRTLLARLIEKGALRRERGERRAVYRAAVTRRRCVREAGRSFLNKIFAGDAASLLMHFARDAKIEPDDVDRLKRLLDEKSKEGKP
jgi:BlaI family transcriptional regulator, penicillinase repressor